MKSKNINVMPGVFNLGWDYGFNPLTAKAIKELKEEVLLKLTEEDLQFFKQLTVAKYPEKIKNPYSGIEVELEPIAVALHDFIKGAEYILNSDAIGSGLKIIQEHYDYAMMLFVKLWPKEYMILLN